MLYFGVPMTPTLKKFGLVAAGAVAGVLVSVGLSAVAQRDSRPNNLPLDELRQFSDVFDHRLPIERKAEA